MKTPKELSSGQPKLHRRSFLKGSGTAAAASALGSGLGLAAPVESKDRRVTGPGLTAIVLNINGRDRRIKVEPRMTLLEVLRYRLHLTGAKPVSSSGASGASTVLVAGKPVMASTILAMQCVGKPIKTCEALAGPRLDPVPAAFVNHDASQCGFCTPGFVVAVRAFLDKHPRASEEQIRLGLNDNVCRCGTYANIIQAAIELAKGGRDA